MKKKILVRGPALTRSGYGEQTRFALRSLRAHEDRFEIFLINTNWGQTGWIFEESEEREWLDLLLKKTILYQQKQGHYYDISLQVTIPNEWEKLAAINIGYTAGIETTKVAPEWIDKSSLMDKIIVISEHAKQTYQNTVYSGTDRSTGEQVRVGCQAPIEVVNYPVREFEPSKIDLDLKTDFNFLLMSQWGVRKNITNSIGWFLKEFQDREDVGLVVKSFLRNNSQTDRSFCKAHLENITNQFPDRKCKIYFLHGDMNDGELTALYQHPKIKAFISLAHGEGFGLSVFEAAYNGLPIISPAWSGVCDYLYRPVKNKKGKVKNRPQFAKVDYKIEQIQKEAVWKGVLQEDSMWCYPQEKSYKIQLQDVQKNYKFHHSRAKKLQKWICSNFTSEKLYKKFVDHIYAPSPEVAEWSEKISLMGEL